MEWTDQALVLRMGAFRESDLWLKLLCREHGLLTLFAFGGRRRFCGCLDVLNSLQCRVRSSKDGRFLNLEEAALLQGPRLLRRNWQRMGLAANCLRFVEAMGVGEDAATEAFLLVEDLRAVLEAEKAPPVLLPLYFRLRLAGALRKAGTEQVTVAGEKIAAEEQLPHIERPLADHRLHREEQPEDERDPQRASGHDLTAGSALGLQKPNAHKTEGEQVEGDRAERHRGDRLPAGGTGDAEPARVQDEKPDDAADKRGGEEKGLEKLYLCADDCADQEKEASPTECAQIRIKCAFHTRSLLLLQYTRQGLRFMETPERRGGRVARHPGGEGGAF